jgi:hypothetical protein
LLKTGGNLNFRHGLTRSEFLAVRPENTEATEINEVMRAARRGDDWRSVPAS